MDARDDAAAPLRDTEERACRARQGGEEIRELAGRLRVPFKTAFHGMSGGLWEDRVITKDTKDTKEVECAVPLVIFLVLLVSLVVPFSDLRPRRLRF